MIDLKFCPKCGSEISEDDVEFCTQCGFKLSGSIQQLNVNSNGFFDNLVEKTSFPIIVFSFIIFGVFLFVGSIFWSFFMAGGSIDLITYLLLVVVFSVFFGGIFVGYNGCKDKSYLIPNFLMYLGSIFAVVLCGIGLIFTILMGIISALSSVLPLGSSGSSYTGSYQSPASSYMSLADFSSVFKIILFILLLPVAAYLGVYLGYILRENI